MFRGFVVEDNAPVRAALVEGLAELAGVTTVGYAGDERTAVSWLTDSANDWDLAIVDLHLGTGGSGYGVLQALTRRQPHQRVVVWTASADPLQKSRCLVLGVDRVFDRATENNQLMDYCMEQSEAQARAASASGRFPAEQPRRAAQRGSFAASLFGG
ncbi:response regulator [Caenimonas terrae]|uniref:Response regulator n=1 Tax=Caenimonas terrae TaxID=696074 RepID=A0ABW0NDQ7_9BURK